MKRPLLMPKLGLTMTEGALVEWTVRPGDRFASEATLFVVETEKTATEVPAEAAGTLLEILIEPGVAVPVGAVLGHWDDGAAGEGDARASTEGAMPAHASTTSLPAHADAPVSPSASTRDGMPRILATPLARRIARDRGIDLSTLTGSGPHGRIRARDVEAVPSPTAAVSSSPRGAPVADPPVVSASTPRAATSAEATIARRMVAAKRDIPHFYLSVEAEVSRLLALREEMRAVQPAARYTLNHFVLAAVGRALAQTPSANIVWTDAGIVQYTAVDLGMAVSTPRGLVAPVLRDLGAASLDQIAQRSTLAIERARAGRLTAAELEGGAITVSNAGMHDVTYMTSIINPGQSLILGVGSVRELFRPDAAGQPALRREMGLVLSADHRVHDAVGALALLKCIVAHLEQPLGLVL